MTAIGLRLETETRLHMCMRFHSLLPGLLKGFVLTLLAATFTWTALGVKRWEASASR